MLTEKALEVVNKIENAKGRFITIHGRRKLKIQKTFTKKHGKIPEIYKETILYMQSGIKYDNISAVKEKRENGELPSENQGLKGMEMIPGFNHLRKSTFGEKIYLTGKPLPNKKSSSKFFLDGVEVSREALEDAKVCYAKDIKASKNSSDWLLYAIDNVTHIS